METPTTRAEGIAERLKKMDGNRLAAEVTEFTFFMKKQFFGQIPSVSAIGGLAIGSWVSSTFTTSPIRAGLAQWGLVKGGRHVVSPAFYRVLSLTLPVMTAALTAYALHKLLKTYREDQLRRHMEMSSRLKEEIQLEIKAKLTLLEKARAAGLISGGEFDTKKANLYRSYSRTPSKIEDLIVAKLSN